MNDLIYCGLSLGFFALTWGMVELFERISRTGS
jgi:hypothetical protein